MMTDYEAPALTELGHLGHEEGSTEPLTEPSTEPSTELQQLVDEPSDYERRSDMDTDVPPQLPPQLPEELQVAPELLAFVPDPRAAYEAGPMGAPIDARMPEHASAHAGQWVQHAPRDAVQSHSVDHVVIGRDAVQVVGHQVTVQAVEAQQVGYAGANGPISGPHQAAEPVGYSGEQRGDDGSLPQRVPPQQIYEAKPLPDGRSQLAKLLRDVDEIKNLFGAANFEAMKEDVLEQTKSAVAAQLRAFGLGHLVEKDSDDKEPK